MPKVAKKGKLIKPSENGRAEIGDEPHGPSVMKVVDP